MSQKYSNSKVWGPHFWFMMRTIAYNYPMCPTVQDIIQTKSFYNIFKFILPCEKCRCHYNKLMHKYPIDCYMTNRFRLMEWVEIIYIETKNSNKKEDAKCYCVLEEICTKHYKKPKQHCDSDKNSDSDSDSDSD